MSLNDSALNKMTGGKWILPETYRQIVDVLPILTMDIQVMNCNGAILQVRRAQEPLKGEWWTPGGRMYKGETMLEACQRILWQELNIAPGDVARVQFKGVLPFENDRSAWNTPAHTMSVVLDAILANHFEASQIKLDTTSSDWRWSHCMDKHPKFNVVPTYTVLKDQEAA
jgi:colanic acid biosynthesis protein WcaH